MNKKFWFLIVCIGALVVLDNPPLFAAAFGDPMPWDTPLQRIFSNLKGVVGPLLLGIGILGFAFTALSSEHHMGSGLVRIILVGSIILFVTGFMTSLWGWSGATF